MNKVIIINCYPRPRSLARARACVYIPLRRRKKKSAPDDRNLVPNKWDLVVKRALKELIKGKWKKKKKKKSNKETKKKFYRELFREDESFLTLGRLSIFYMHWLFDYDYR